MTSSKQHSSCTIYNKLKLRQSWKSKIWHLGLLLVLLLLHYESRKRTTTSFLLIFFYTNWYNKIHVSFHFHSIQYADLQFNSSSIMNQDFIPCLNLVPTSSKSFLISAFFLRTVRSKPSISILTGYKTWVYLD